MQLKVCDQVAISSRVNSSAFKVELEGVGEKRTSVQIASGGFIKEGLDKLIFCNVPVVVTKDCPKYL